MVLYFIVFIITAITVFIATKLIKNYLVVFHTKMYYRDMLT